jgi:hypothetical protein
LSVFLNLLSKPLFCKIVNETTQDHGHAKGLDPFFLLEEVFRVAVQDEVSFYDSLFLAAAERERVPLLTLDKKTAR